MRMEMIESMKSDIGPDRGLAKAPGLQEGYSLPHLCEDR
jgi:hypothetical protein